MPRHASPGLMSMPLTPIVSRPIGRASDSSHLMALPAVETIITFSPVMTRRTEMSSSSSRRLIAMMPSRRERSYACIAVFFTMPCFVANMRNSSGENVLVLMTAAIFSVCSNGSRLTTAAPFAWREPSGSSCTFIR